MMVCPVHVFAKFTFYIGGLLISAPSDSAYCTLMYPLITEHNFEQVYTYVHEHNIRRRP